MMKTILILGSLAFLMYDASAQDLPIDDSTGRVTYSGEVILSGKSIRENFDKAINWITAYNAFRGNFNAIYADSENGAVKIKAVIYLDLNSTFKTTLWYANCCFSISISDNSISYRISNIYTYMCLSLYRSMLMSDMPYEIELEKNTQFKINDISASENTKILDQQILKIIDSLKELFKE